MNGESSLYEAWSINVIASAVGSSPPSPPESPSQPQTPPPQEPPAEVPVPAKTPQIKPPTAGTLKVLSSNSFVDRIGFYHVVGEIQNGTPDPVTSVQASATFYDKNNKVVGTGFGYTRPTDLGPSDKAPFEIILGSSSIPANQIKNYRVTASHD